MNAFLTSLVLVAAISVGAWLGLESIERPSSEAFKVEGNVRL